MYSCKAHAADPLDRLPRRDPVDRLPRPDRAHPGLVVVDATWGIVQPLRLPGGVETVGELEVIAHIRGGGLLVDTRLDEYVVEGTIPGAVGIPHAVIAERLAAMPRRGPVVLFCNGPQCTATPKAVAALLAAGWAPADLRYYRGGLHDWVTLGLPLALPERIDDVA